MATAPELELRGTDGFVVESPEGGLGFVEEVWLDDHGQPHALAVTTTDGRHGLLLRDEVVAVDQENRWVVVGHSPTLLELQPPRIEEGVEGGGQPLVARWETTGEVVPAPPRRPPLGGVASRLAAAVRKRVGFARRDVPPVYAIAVLLVSLALIVATVTALVFLAAKLITGGAY
jgi:hypothetical protein